MQHLGVTPELLEMAQEVGIAIVRATKGFEATHSVVIYLV